MSEQIRDVLESVHRTGVVEARSTGESHDVFPVAITAAEGQALREWIVRERASRTIEVGLGYGISTLYICDGILSVDRERAAHVAIDPHQATSFADCGVQLLEEAGVVERVEIHAEDSRLLLPRFAREGRPFDFAFIDGNHRFDGVFLDLMYLGRLVRRGGLLFVDDYHLAAIQKAVGFCVTNLGWGLEEVSEADAHHHWAVIRTAKEPDARPFDYFVDF